MATIGYHASHEQFPPGETLACVQAAERAGFAAAMCSDHFAPWSERQGHSGFAWAWLGAALQATSLPFGVVNAPGDRYHPAIIAQAAATLAEMFPGRFWVALGSGQALNEHITGAHWPLKTERNARLRECVEVIRALWAGETVTHHGRVRVEEARLWSLPAQPPRIIGAALSEETAEFIGGWADGMITVNAPREQLLGMIEAFHCGGGEGKPLFLQCHLSYARSEKQARANAFDQWRTNTLPGIVNEHLRTTRQFDAAAQTVRPEDLDRSVRIASDLERHLEWLRDDLALGFDHLYLHNVGRNQREFIEVFGRRVLPDLT
jgi:probable non-F420 flavinoid oxidoreductase